MKPNQLEIIQLDEIPANSFIVLKVDVRGPMEKYQAADITIGNLNKYNDIFTEKKITLLILTPKESIDILTEDEMNKAGWYRK